MGKGERGEDAPPPLLTASTHMTYSATAMMTTDLTEDVMAARNFIVILVCSDVLSLSWCPAIIVSECARRYSKVVAGSRHVL